MGYFDDLLEPVSAPKQGGYFDDLIPSAPENTDSKIEIARNIDRLAKESFSQPDVYQQTPQGKRLEEIAAELKPMFKTEMEVTTPQNVTDKYDPKKYDELYQERFKIQRETRNKDQQATLSWANPFTKKTPLDTITQGVGRLAEVAKNKQRLEELKSQLTPEEYNTYSLAAKATDWRNNDSLYAKLPDGRIRFRPEVFDTRENYNAAVSKAVTDGSWTPEQGKIALDKYNDIEKERDYSLFTQAQKTPSYQSFAAAHKGEDEPVIWDKYKKDQGIGSKIGYTIGEATKGAVDTVAYPIANVVVNSINSLAEATGNQAIEDAATDVTAKTIDMISKPSYWKDVRGGFGEGVDTAAQTLGQVIGQLGIVALTKKFGGAAAAESVATGVGLTSPLQVGMESYLSVYNANAKRDASGNVTNNEEAHQMAAEAMKKTMPSGLLDILPIESILKKVPAKRLGKVIKTVTSALAEVGTENLQNKWQNDVNSAVSEAYIPSQDMSLEQNVGMGLSTALVDTAANLLGKHPNQKQTTTPPVAQQNPSVPLVTNNPLPAPVVQNLAEQQRIIQSTSVNLAENEAPITAQVVSNIGDESIKTQVGEQVTAKIEEQMDNILSQIEGESAFQTDEQKYGPPTLSGETTQPVAEKASPSVEEAPLAAEVPLDVAPESSTPELTNVTNPEEVTNINPQTTPDETFTIIPEPTIEVERGVPSVEKEGLQERQGEESSPEGIRDNGESADEARVGTEDSVTESRTPEAVRATEELPPLEAKPIDSAFKRILKLKGVVVLGNGAYRIPAKLMTVARRRSLEAATREDKSVRFRTGTMGEMSGNYDNSVARDTVIYDESVRGARANRPTRAESNASNQSQPAPAATTTEQVEAQPKEGGGTSKLEQMTPEEIASSRVFDTPNGNVVLTEPDIIKEAEKLFGESAVRDAMNSPMPGASPISEMIDAIASNNGWKYGGVIKTARIGKFADTRSDLIYGEFKNPGMLEGMRASEAVKANRPAAELRSLEIKKQEAEDIESFKKERERIESERSQKGKNPPIPVEVIASIGIIPKGYVRKGELYVYEPSTKGEPNATNPEQVEAQPKEGARRGQSKGRAKESVIPEGVKVYEGSLDQIFAQESDPYTRNKILRSAVKKASTDAELNDILDRIQPQELSGNANDISNDVFVSKNASETTKERAKKIYDESMGLPISEIAPEGVVTEENAPQIIGKRVLKGSTPAAWRVTEVLPQTETEKANGEQYVTVQKEDAKGNLVEGTQEAVLMDELREIKAGPKTKKAAAKRGKKAEKAIKTNLERFFGVPSLRSTPILSDSAMAAKVEQAGELGLFDDEVTPKSILEKLGNNKSLPAWARQLAKIVASVAPTNISFEVTNSPNENFGALYIQDGDSRRVIINIAKGSKHVGLDLLHEIAHSFTAQKLEQDPSTLSESDKRAVEALNKVAEEIKAHPEFRGEYGASSVVELVGEAFSSPRFRRKLERLGTEATSLWSRFIRAIGRILTGKSVAPSSTLESVIKNALTLGGAPVIGKSNYGTRNVDRVGLDTSVQEPGLQEMFETSRRRARSLQGTPRVGRIVGYGAKGFIESVEQRTGSLAGEFTSLLHGLEQSGVDLFAHSGTDTLVQTTPGGTIAIKFGLGTEPSAPSTRIKSLLDEEIVHAIGDVGLRRLWEKQPDSTRGSFVDFRNTELGSAAEEVFRKADEVDGDEGVKIRNLIRSVYATYYAELKYDKDIPLYLAIRDSFEKSPTNAEVVPFANFASELARQVVQLRTKGEITEGTMRQFLNGIAEWFQKALQYLRLGSESIESGALKGSQIDNLTSYMEKSYRTLSGKSTFASEASDPNDTDNIFNEDASDSAQIEATQSANASGEKAQRESKIMESLKTPLSKEREKLVVDAYKSGWVQKMVNKWRNINRKADPSDYESAIGLALHYAAQTWNPSASQFNTYATRIVDNDLINIARKSTRGLKVEQPVSSFVSPEFSHEQAIDTLSKGDTPVVGLEADRAKFFKDLNDVSKFVAKQYGKKDAWKGRALELLFFGKDVDGQMERIPMQDVAKEVGHSSVQISQLWNGYRNDPGAAITLARELEKRGWTKEEMLALGGREESARTTGERGRYASGYDEEAAKSQINEEEKLPTNETEKQPETSEGNTVPDASSGEVSERPDDRAFGAIIPRNGGGKDASGNSFKSGVAYTLRDIFGETGDVGSTADRYDRVLKNIGVRLVFHPELETTRVLPFAYNRLQIGFGNSINVQKDSRFVESLATHEILHALAIHLRGSLRPELSGKQFQEFLHEDAARMVLSLADLRETIPSAQWDKLEKAFLASFNLYDPNIGEHPKFTSFNDLLNYLADTSDGGDSTPMVNAVHEFARMVVEMNRLGVISEQVTDGVFSKIYDWIKSSLAAIRGAFSLLQSEGLADTEMGRFVKDLNDLANNRIPKYETATKQEASGGNAVPSNGEEEVRTRYDSGRGPLAGQTSTETTETGVDKSVLQLLGRGTEGDSRLSKFDESLKKLGVRVVSGTGGNPISVIRQADGKLLLRIAPEGLVGVSEATIGRLISEEAIHIVSAKINEQEWRDSGSSDSFQEFIANKSREILDDLLVTASELSADQSRTVLDALVSSYNAYQIGNPNFTPATSIYEVLDRISNPSKDEMISSIPLFVEEATRQLIQKRRLGQITKETLSTFLDKFREWMGKAIEAIKKVSTLLTSDQLKDTGLAKHIAQIESFIDGNVPEIFDSGPTTLASQAEEPASATERTTEVLTPHLAKLDAISSEKGNKAFTQSLSQIASNWMGYEGTVSELKSAIEQYTNFTGPVVQSIADMISQQYEYQKGLNEVKADSKVKADFIGEHSFAKRTADEFDQVFQDKMGKYYEVLRNVDSVDQANEVLKNMSISQAVVATRDNASGIPFGVRTMMGQITLKRIKEYRKQLKREGNTEAYDFETDNHIAFNDWFNDYAKDLGQGIQSFSRWTDLGADGILRKYQRDTEKVIDGFKKKNKKRMADVKSDIESEDKKAFDESTKTTKKADAARRTAKREARKVTIEEQAKKIAERLARRLAGEKPEIKTNPVSELVNAHIKKLDPDFISKAKALGISEETANKINGAAIKFDEQRKKLTEERAIKKANYEAFLEASKALAQENKQLYGPTDTIWEQYQEQFADRLARELMPSSGKPTPPALKLFTQRLTNNLLGFIPKGDRETTTPASFQSSIEDALNNRDRYAEAFDSAIRQIAASQDDIGASRLDRAAAEGSAEFLESIAPLIKEFPVSPSLVDKFVNQKAKQIDLSLNNAFTEWYKGDKKTRRTIEEIIVTKLTGDVNVSPDDAATLAKAIVEDFKKKAEARRIKAIDRIKAPKATEPATKDNSKLKKFFEMVNMGVLSDEDSYNIVAEKFNLPRFDPAFSKEIYDKAQEIEELPEGLKKSELTRELLSAIAIKNGFAASDFGSAFIYGNVLSSPDTSLVNVVDTMINVFAGGISDYVASGGKDSKRLEGILKGYRKGWFDGLEVLKTGQNIGMRKLDEKAPRILELSKFGTKGGVPIQERNAFDSVMKGLLESKPAAIFNMWKYVGRLLDMQDAVNNAASKEGQRYSDAHRQAVSEGLTSREAINRRMSEILNTTDEAYQKALEQAKSEGYSGNEAAFRAIRITEENIPEAIKVRSLDRALEDVYRNAPVGFAGYMADQFQRFIKQIENPLLRNIVQLNTSMFVVTPTNVFNRWLDWSPYGFKRAFFGTGIGLPEQFKREAPDKDTQEFRSKIFKASSSVLLLGVIQALVKAGAMSINGKGPDDDEEKAQWKADGNMPYSVRFGDGPAISFKYTPWAVTLAALANFNDWDKYKKGSKKDLATRMTVALGMLPSFVMELPFFKGPSDLLDAINAGKRGGGAKAITNLAESKTGMLFPNFLRYVDRLFDPKVYNSTDIKALYIDQVPFVRRLGQPALDMFGEPIGEGKELAERLSGRFVAFPKPSPQSLILAKFNAYPSMDKPGEAVTVVKGERVPMTRMQYEAYAVGVGQDFKKYLLDKFDPKKDYTEEQIEKDKKLISQKHEELKGKWKKKVSSLR